MISINRRRRVDRPLVAVIVNLVAALLFALPANAAPWTQPEYLYRYFVWGAQFIVSSRSDDYKHYSFHTIDQGPDAFHFAPGKPDAVPDTVEYSEGDTVKRVALKELLRTTGTHAFIVIKDNQLLYEDYFNGFGRDSLCTAWSVSKSVTSALVGIAISEGYIKSLDDPITNYLPELKGRGFDAITIRNLLTMGSGIQYRISFFPWDEFVLAGYYPDLRQLLLSDLTIMEPPGQSFHYNNFNVELLGMILERTTKRPPSQYLEEKIWKPIGMEYPATWSIDSERDGFELTPIMFNARAIDLAKFGGFTSTTAIGTESRSFRSNGSSNPLPKIRPTIVHGRLSRDGRIRAVTTSISGGAFREAMPTTTTWASAPMASSFSFHLRQMS